MGVTKNKIFPFSMLKALVSILVPVSTVATEICGQNTRV